jgi:hypothetical protein
MKRKAIDLKSHRNNSQTFAQRANFLRDVRDNEPFSMWMLVASVVDFISNGMLWRQR